MSKELRYTNEVSGDGLWNQNGASVTGALKFKVYKPEQINDKGFAEGRFYLDKGVWDTESNGLIYTNDQFIADLQDNLKNSGFKHWQEINYSEAGMQGDDYVSMDASYALAKEVQAAGYDISLPGKKPAPLDEINSLLNEVQTLINQLKNKAEKLRV